MAIVTFKLMTISWKFPQNAGFLRSLEKYGKFWSMSSLEKNFFRSVSMEKENNFPDLHFWHAFT